MHQEGNHPIKLFSKIGLFVASSLASGSVNASILIDQSSPFFYQTMIGSPGWTTFAGMLAAEPNGYKIGSVANSADVSAATGILIELRNFNDTLSAAEIANISSAVASGKHVAIFGENSSWIGWDASIIDFASGGTATHVVINDFSGTATVAVTNSLTKGVSPFFVAGTGLHTPGGINLFDTSFATLWQNQNLLTILDVDSVGEGLGNRPFMQNIADWLAQSQGPGSAVPEPATWALMVLGFGVVGFSIRRGAVAVRRVAQ